jgi:hypothetical protein
MRRSYSTTLIEIIQYNLVAGVVKPKAPTVAHRGTTAQQIRAIVRSDEMKKMTEVHINLSAFSK